LERVNVYAIVDIFSDGSVEYVGESDVDWSSQEADLDDGEAVVYCQNNHRWTAIYSDLPMPVEVLDALDDMTTMERAISQSRPFSGPLDFRQLKEAAREWDRLYEAAGYIEKYGDNRFFPKEV
jgi:hypothetical protein